ncbi:MAG: recombinase family protein [Cellulosilyticaceae bacterium]
MKVTILEPEVILKKKKVCAYARVSTGSESQGESLENQVQYYTNKIKTNPDYEFVGIFADRGYTGTKEDRPQFQKMLGLCREGEIDLILTKSVSRFARNTTIILEYVRELKLLGVEIHFEKENIKTLSKDGELMLTVLSSFAEEESRSTSENIKWCIQKKFERGEANISTGRFLGYDNDEYGDLVINKEEAEIVQRIFNDYLKGEGSFKIAKQLNKEGVPTVTGAKWSDSAILVILKNEKYKGDVRLQKYYRPNHLCKRNKRNTGQRGQYYIHENHPPIISKEIWDKVQEEIKRRAYYKQAKANQNRYPLSGLLICSKCGAKLKRRTWNKGKSSEKIVWQCSTYIKTGKDACTGTTIPDGVISQIDIREQTIVREWVENGEKHYLYTSKSRE